VCVCVCVSVWVCVGVCVCVVRGACASVSVYELWARADEKQVEIVKTAKNSYKR